MKALVLFSGGVDSTTALAMAISEYGNENVIALSISYGQKHLKEIEASKKLVEYYKVRHIELDLYEIFKYSNSTLLNHSDGEIPFESYKEQLDKTDGSPVSTYVPFRNGLFISSAASIAISTECSLIYYGAHSDDAAGNAYPDCSTEFNEAMKTALYKGSGDKLQLLAPFVNLTKAEVVKIGTDLGVPYELTWSCYVGEDKPCGKCGTCIDRKNAFILNGLIDPLDYSV